MCLSAAGEYGASTYNMNFDMSVKADGMSEVLVVPVKDLKTA